MQRIQMLEKAGMTNEKTNQTDSRAVARNIPSQGQLVEEIGVVIHKILGGEVAAKNSLTNQDEGQPGVRKDKK